MINYHDYLECIDYSPTFIEKFGWACYGEDAYISEYWNNKHEGEGVSIEAVFNIRTHDVYEIKIYDGIHNREYQWITPALRQARLDEYAARDINPFEGIDGGKVIELEVEEDVLEKMKGAFLEQDYDTKIMISLNLEHDLEKKLREMAEARGITLDQLVEDAIKQEIEMRKREQNVG